MATCFLYIQKHILSFVLTFVVLFSSCTICHAQNYTVTNTGDSGSGSLRRAIMDMNSAGLSPSKITFAGFGTINLLTKLPDINVSVDINDTSQAITIDGSSISGAGVGLAHGISFMESTSQISNLRNVLLRNFDGHGVVVAPTSVNENVNIRDCTILDCSKNGVHMTSGKFHTIVNSTLQRSGLWGVCLFNSALDRVDITNSNILENNIGGILLCGTDHDVRGCNILANGFGSSLNGGIVFGASGGIGADNCSVENCTLALNSPSGAKRVFGTGIDMLSNETYSNTVQGYDVNVTAPFPTAKRFIIDNVNNKMIMAGTFFNAPSNSIVKIQLFTTSNGTLQGADHLEGGDLNVLTDANGAGSFTHKVDTSQNWNAVVVGGPINYDIDATDRPVFTVTSESSTGTSEFSNLATPTVAGDFNLDGHVDAADFALWSQNFGSQSAEYWDGDADFDGDVDGSDYLILQQNFGS